MTRTSSFLLIVVTVAVVTAVGVGAVGTSGPAPVATQTDGGTDDVQVRILHASPDAPPVDVSVDGEVVASSLEYGQETSLTAAAGNHSVEIVAAANDTGENASAPADNETTAAGNESDALYSENVTFEAGTDYTIAAAGEVSEGAERPFDPIVFPRNATDVGDDEAAVSLVHLSPDAPAVDVTENTTGEVVFENVSYGEATEPVTLPAGEYTLDVRVESETNDGEIVDSVDVPLDGGTAYSAFAIGYVADENATEDRAFTVLLSEDVPSDGATNATETPMTETPTEEGTTTEGGTVTEQPGMTATPAATETDT